MTAAEELAQGVGRAAACRASSGITKNSASVTRLIENTPFAVLASWLSSSIHKPLPSRSPNRHYTG